MEPLLEVRGVCKRFGPTRALHQVDLSVHPGEVLALIGENGAGKSTLLKVLSGAHPADRGTLLLHGKEFAPQGPHDARSQGVAMIYQELNLAPDLSVEDNVLLGQPGTAGGLLFRGQQRRRVVDALKLVGLEHIDPRAIAGKQPVAVQQLLEVSRALVSDAKLILFDEPTSSLPQRDVERLFAIIGRLKEQGLAIVYISHFLEEVREIADRYTVLRDGENVGQGTIAAVTDEQIVSMMVGRDVDELYPHVPHELGPTVLKVEQLSGMPVPRQACFELRKGEILGIAGLVGAGRTELLRCLFGLEPAVAGQVAVADEVLKPSLRARMRAGIALLSEDRKAEGLAQRLSIADNITLSNLRPYTRWGWLNLPARDRGAEQLMQQVEIKAHSAHQSVEELSGGNQQKVAIARILHQQSEILLMDEPTKGIDVGTKAEIYRMLGELAREGKSVIFVSSYLPELMAVCDRIGVMARGRLRDIRPAKEWTEDAIMHCAVDLERTETDSPAAPAGHSMSS